MMMLPNILMTILFNYFSHPLAMTLIIICQTVILSLSMSIITKTFWMSYILSLVFLGGMLVLFLYITSLASNEYSLPPPPTLTTWLYISSVLLTLMIPIYFSDQTFWNLLSMNMDTHPLEMSSSFIPSTNQHLMLNKLYNTYSSMLTIILVTYLLITLIAIVKITNIYMGPLRSSFFQNK
uniref:NADH-ubiquinone oxidoreductase chain 6 n=1 Tax=Phyllomimus sp. YH-2018 TaxID=2100095 RepID=A0A343UWC0_9ORTH|nr:NADH dehydrogenase subunit 6 [Phyllomimus sp. YH-2018]